MNGELCMEKRCFACMNKIDSDVCSRCGNSNADMKDVDKSLIQPGTILHDQYYIGFAIEQNGEGVTYISFDTLEKKRVRVREFYPDTMCHREKDSKEVVVNNGCEIQYKSLMTDFVELSKQLIEFKSNNSLIKAKLIFSENNTIYTIYEDVVGITLTRYLRENAGELSWEETENLFLPLLYTVKLLNSQGIIHRGISPETIIVTPENELKLTGVCTSGARANNSEIKPELYIGYAAPEQYQKCTSYGEWTDVYSLCAVLYKTLTGTMPPRADLRDAHDELVTPIQLNSSIPQTVSDAIARGLAYRQEARTRYVKDLIGALYSSQSVIVENDNSSYYDSTKKRKFKLPIWLIVILITLPILLGLFFLTYNFVLGPKNNVSSLSSSELEETSSTEETVAKPSEPTSSEASSSMIMQSAVDNFVDQLYDDIIVSDAYNKMYKFKKVEEYNDHIPVGVVMEQTPEANKIVPQGTEIVLKVSKGIRYVQLFPITDGNGMSVSVDAYKKTLVDSGFEVKVESIDAAGIPSGDIVKLSVPLDKLVDREEISSITIYVAK